MDDNKKLLKTVLPILIVGAVIMILSSAFLNSMDASISDKTKAKKEQATEKKEDKQSDANKDIITALKMRIGDEEFNVDVDLGAAGQEFAKATPFEMTMKELNGNEKYYQGDDKFENANETDVGYLEVGDIMLYGDDTVVIFYDNFKTDYKYTRLGWIQEKTKLIEMLGDGDVTVAFTKN